MAQKLKKLRHIVALAEKEIIPVLQRAGRLETYIPGPEVPAYSSNIKELSFLHSANLLVTVRKNQGAPCSMCNNVKEKFLLINNLENPAFV